MAPTRLAGPRVRLLATSSAGALLASLITVSLAAAPEASAMPPVTAGPSYHATITRTQHGIPHIVASDYGSLGFGSGYATAQTTICTLADILLTARGERSRYLGATGRYDDLTSMNGTNLQVDALVTDLHNRKVVEGLLASSTAGPGPSTQAMVDGYAAGVNKYLTAIGGAGNISDPA